MQILERDLEDVELSKKDSKTSFEVELRGFQVLTVKLVIANNGCKVNEDGWEQL